uniref:Uncharacterized protein n=1 Tax=Helianthus annuus TaxID=4232 RepID=A0A251V3I3_HELAN
MKLNFVNPRLIFKLFNFVRSRRFHKVNLFLLLLVRLLVSLSRCFTFGFGVILLCWHCWSCLSQELTRRILKDFAD